MSEKIYQDAMRGMAVKIANLEMENAILQAQVEALTAPEPTPGLQNIPAAPDPSRGEPIVDPENPYPIAED